MDSITNISNVPNKPAVYAMYGGHGKREYVVYVGVADHLKHRVNQHLVRHNSSITTGESAVKLQTDHVVKISWWEHRYFTDRVKLEAAELIAFELFNPIINSRTVPRKESVELLTDDKFTKSIQELLRSPPNGVIALKSLNERVQSLEKRIIELEQKMRYITSNSWENCALLNE